MNETSQDTHWFTLDEYLDVETTSEPGESSRVMAIAGDAEFRACANAVLHDGSGRSLRVLGVELEIERNPPSAGVRVEVRSRAASTGSRDAQRLTAALAANRDLTLLVSADHRIITSNRDLRLAGETSGHHFEKVTDLAVESAKTALHDAVAHTLRTGLPSVLLGRSAITSREYEVRIVRVGGEPPEAVLSCRDLTGANAFDGERARIRPPRTRDASRAWRVLVADDEAAIRTLLARLISAKGHEPIVASDGAEALAAILDGRVDAAVLDVVMPNMSGIEVARRARNERAIPILLMSGFARGTRHTDLDDLPLLRKPFGRTRFDEALASLLERLPRTESVTASADQDCADA